jgi:hypothetical protein
MNVYKPGTFSMDSEPSLTPPEPPPAYVASCGHEITAPDDLELMRGESGGGYEWEGKIICPECAESKLDELINKTPLKVKMFSLLRSDFITLEELRCL